MNTISKHHIWYATPERIQSITKISVLDDRGSLDITPSQLVFKGAKSTLTIDRATITSITITGQTINWVVYAIINLVFIVILLPVPELLFFLLIMLVPTNLMGIMIGMKTKWVCIEHATPDTKPAKAYFADGSGFGWKGVLDGTKKLYQEMQS